MPPRHAAALALLGWYLMTPPIVSTSPFRIDLDAPLSRWDIQESFDTAEDCENLYMQLADKHPKNSQEDLRYRTGHCIATDDPRLKGK